MTTTELETEPLRLLAEPEFDSQLRVLVDVVNDLPDDTRIGITLTAQGLVISGFLIPASLWQRQRAGIAGVIAPLFSGLAAKHEAKRAANNTSRDDGRDRDTDADLPASFIHLVNARIYTGSDGFPLNGLAWRGRLSQVTGWSLGVFEKSTD
jgi:hypothetical protein